MSVNSQFPIAELSENQLKKIEKLEEDLRQETGENIFLIAYDEEN